MKRGLAAGPASAFDNRKPPSGACPNQPAAPRCDQREPTAWAAETDGTRISRAASAALPFSQGLSPNGDLSHQTVIGTDPFGAVPPFALRSADGPVCRPRERPQAP